VFPISAARQVVKAINLEGGKKKGGGNLLSNFRSNYIERGRVFRGGGRAAGVWSSRRERRERKRSGFSHDGPQEKFR